MREAAGGSRNHHRGCAPLGSRARFFLIAAAGSQQTHRGDHQKEAARDMPLPFSAVEALAVRGTCDHQT